jgi:hypothetical protein
MMAFDNPYNLVFEINMYVSITKLLRPWMDAHVSPSIHMG